MQKATKKNKNLAKPSTGKLKIAGVDETAKKEEIKQKTEEIPKLKMSGATAAPSKDDSYLREQKARLQPTKKRSWKRGLLFVQFLGVAFILGMLATSVNQYRDTNPNPDTMIVPHVSVFAKPENLHS